MKAIGLPHTAVLVSAVLAGTAFAGPLTGVNLLQNPGFEPDAQGTHLPAQWTSFDSGAPALWDGVTPYVAPATDLPPARAGGGANTYGDFTNSQTVATLGQTLNLPGGGDPQEAWLGLWLFHLTHPLDVTGGVRLRLYQAATGADWASPWLTSDFDAGQQILLWTQKTFSIPASQGFQGGLAELSIELDTGTVNPPAWQSRGVWVDDVEVEALPEPTTLLLMGAPIPLILRRRRDTV